MTDISRPDPWTELRTHTRARIALGRSGAGLPTAELLRFGVAHAQARDAVHMPLDVAALHGELTAHGFDAIELTSSAGERTTYLQRPDLGRRLSDHGAAALRAYPDKGGAIVCVIGDGLSARAVQRHALALLLELRARLEPKLGAPIVLARQARVALGDQIGELLHAALVIMLIGERPGLSSPDSLGAYLTWAPRVGCVDSQRNCVSNIRPEGLRYGEAAHKIAWLAQAALARRVSGVALKDETDRTALANDRT